MDGLAEKARSFAAKAHERQVRPNKARLPFITHLEEVVLLVEESGGSDEEIAAAWLHDVVEDTPVTLDEIAAHFGAPLAEMVDALTDPPDFSGLPTIVRKMRQAERIRSKGNDVKRVKIADQTANVRSIAADPPVTWDRKKCMDYVIGAGRIVFECLGVSEFLEEEFDKAYHFAFKAYRQ